MDMTNMKNTDTTVYIRNGEELDMTYSTDIPMSMKLTFIDSVIDSVVVGGDYYSILKDMMFDFRLIQFFSDVDIDIADDGDTINNIEEFMDNNNAADVLKINIDMDVLFELVDSVDKAIEYKTGIHPSPIADSIASLLNVVEKKFSEFDMDSMTGMAKTFAKMQGDITPEKMLEAYAKSDIFKKQHEDVVVAQEKRDADMKVVHDNILELV